MFGLFKLLLIIVIFWPLGLFIWALKRSELIEGRWMFFLVMLGLSYIWLLLVPISLVKGLGVASLFFTYRLLRANIREAIELNKKAVETEKDRINAQKETEIKQEKKKPFDPYQVLQLPCSATPEQIQSQFRKLIAQYHPDKVSHLGKELQDLAHEKTLEITRAYEMLS